MRVEGVGGRVQLWSLGHLSDPPKTSSDTHYFENMCMHKSSTSNICQDRCFEESMEGSIIPLRAPRPNNTHTLTYLQKAEK